MMFLVSFVLLLCASSNLAHGGHDDNHLDRVHYNSVSQFYNGVISSNAAGILHGTIPIPNILDPGVRGRVHPTFLNLDYNLTVEYFWALTSSGYQGFAVTNVLIQNFANDGDRCWFKAILEWTNAVGKSLYIIVPH
jgi:hypothetical protein